MPSIPADQRLPKPFVVVWATTDSGRKVTAYVKSNGEWVINCPKVAAENPTIVGGENEQRCKLELYGGGHNLAPPRN